MRVFAGLILAVLLGAMSLSLFTLSHGMDMANGMSDCPFMVHSETMCPMTIMDHLGAWQTAFQMIVPSMLLLIAGASVCALLLSVAPRVVRFKYRRPPISSIHLRERTYTFWSRPLQELFSNGILHPKLFWHY